MKICEKYCWKFDLYLIDRLSAYLNIYEFSQSVYAVNNTVSTVKTCYAKCMFGHFSFAIEVSVVSNKWMNSTMKFHVFALLKWNKQKNIQVLEPKKWKMNCLCQFKTEYTFTSNKRPFRVTQYFLISEIFSLNFGRDCKLSRK